MYRTHLPYWLTQFLKERCPSGYLLFITLLTPPYMYILKTLCSLLPSPHDAMSLNQAFHKNQLTEKKPKCKIFQGIATSSASPAGTLCTENSPEVNFNLLIFSWDASCLPDAFVIVTNHLCFALFLFHSFCTGLSVDVQEQSPLSFVDYWNPFIKRLDLKQQAGL